MSNQDHKFFDLFMLVIGILVGITIIIFFLARYMASETQDRHIVEGAIYQQQIADRIKPVGSVALPGDQAGQNEKAAAKAAAAAPVAATLSGLEVFNTACAACHGPGIAGAPKVGDAAAWADRIATGMDKLKEHAVTGFQGKTGFMPPKGGRADLSDDEIHSAVEYMVSESQ